MYCTTQTNTHQPSSHPTGSAKPDPRHANVNEGHPRVFIFIIRVVLNKRCECYIHNNSGIRETCQQTNKAKGKYIHQTVWLAFGKSQTPCNVHYTCIHCQGSVNKGRAFLSYTRLVYVLKVVRPNQQVQQFGSAKLQYWNKAERNSALEIFYIHYLS